jgi:hypothetical protein
MASQTVVFAPIVSAFTKAIEAVGGKEDGFQVSNFGQIIFLVDYYSKRSQLDKFRPEERRSWVSQYDQDLNKVLAQEGIGIKLKKMTGFEMGILSVSDFLPKWKKEVVQDEIYAFGKFFPAVKMKAGEYIEGEYQIFFNIYIDPNAKKEIICLETKEGDHVYMMMADKEKAEDDYIAKIDYIRCSSWFLADYNELIFPMINYDNFTEIAWLRGMRMQNSIGFTWRVSQALQQVRFKMNQFGVQARGIDAIVPKSDPIPNSFVIDQSFYLWIERKGLPFPTIYAYFDTDAWKDTGALEM